MASSGLFAEMKQHPWIMALVVAVHIGLIVLLSINLLDDDKPPMPASQKHQTINAIAVDAKAYDDREKNKKLVAQKKIDDIKAAKEKERQELERKKEQEKKIAMQKQKALEVKKREQKLAAEKKAEQKKKQLAIANQKEAEQKLAKEKLAQEKLAREKKAEELKIQQEKLRQQQAAEKKRMLEEKQRRADEKAEFERAMLEEERREEQARVQAARAARLQTQREQYAIDIAKKVENNWLRPAMTSAGQSCDVVVRQTMSGDVIDVQLQSCNADANDAFQRSVERAVRKASPLPLPPDPELFDQQILFKFKPGS
ncbi:MAG: cell envelope integrity protein TolA [Gammaproteobacteria bacterium]|nr:cell envelope integrity protein TolA [Gammaproteobacteria bacterium]